MFVSRTEMEKLKFHNSHLESEVYHLKLKLRLADETNEVLENKLIAIKRELEATKKPKCKPGDWCAVCEFSIMTRDKCGKPIYFCNRDIACECFVQSIFGKLTKEGD